MATTALRYDPTAHLEFTSTDVVYRRDASGDLQALVYQPKGAGPFPAILEIHGGAWNSGDRTNNPAIAEGLAASGVVVASIDFRMGGDHPYPSSLQDINYATRWLKAHATELRADPASVGGLGVSSGGHLILLSGMRPADPRYAELPFSDGQDATLSYVISCWGVIDALGRYRLAQSDGRAELVGNHDRYFLTEAAMEDGNPLMMLQRGERAVLPPLLLIQGTADESLPKGMVEDVHAHYSAAGGESELALFDGQPHGIAGWSAPAVEKMLERMKAFIARRVSGRFVAG
ncbi:MAG: alpha/beta hydrolase [Chloroflexota bacterium]